ncbi:MAG: histidine phosphatase family protein [Richelia sp. CSU_2_1]|nr:histidine phosphatase family protein [Microcoleus sp. SU_5_6]NJL66540.1 histidine phosphatase family protein [Microcoleus sp. SM1_3_4]NJR22876.1 histidine phosphatase family protein [Richelia sp. CSU_2_1]
MNNTTRIILVRHGQSIYNQQGLYQGCCDDSLLTEKGRLTAYQTGLFLSNISLDAVYSSPLKRARETASEILSAIATIADTHPELHVHQNLKEIDLPAWNGLSFKYVREHLAEDYRCWRERPHEFQMAAEIEDKSLDVNSVATLVKPQNFPVQNLYRQAQNFWAEMLPKSIGKTILIITHGGTIKALISTAIGMKCQDFHTLQQSNCGISILSFDSAGDRTELEAMNLTNHLGEVLPKLKEGKQGLRLLLVPADSEKDVYTDSVARIIEKSPIDFCLNSEGENSAKMAEKLIRSRPNPTVQLSVSTERFMQTWHQTIYGRDRQNSSLCTGLVVAETGEIRAALNQVLGLPTQHQSLQVKPGTIDILHYPASAKHPVLQAMNLSGTIS